MTDKSGVAISSFTKLNELPGSIKVDKHLFPKITVVTAKDKHSGTVWTEHNAGELMQADVSVEITAKNRSCKV